MCTTCNVALNIAESPQADRQRAFIRGLIAQGLDKQQIKAALVAEYGEDVLALPESDGFGWTAYAIPLGLLRRARRRPRAAAAELAAALAAGHRRHDGRATLSDDDARRLDDDLGRYA